MVVTYRMKKNRACTLVEILSCLAVVGILLSFAIPQYGLHVERAKAIELVNLSNQVKDAMIEYHVRRGHFVENYGDTSARNIEIGLLNRDAYKTDVIDQMWVGSEGVHGYDDTSAHIAITYNSTLSETRFFLSTIQYVNGEYLFVCGNTNAKWVSNLEHEFLPKECQN